MVGAAGAAGLRPMASSLFTVFIRQKRISAWIRKLTTDAAKLEPKAAASCRVYRAAPVSRLMMGLMKLSVREVTMPEKALPIMTPTAMSITLPRRANALNSWMNLRI